MKKLCTLLAFILAIVGVEVTARADDASLRATLTGRYAAMKSAMASRNTAIIAALYTPDAVDIDSSCQTETRDQMMSEIASLPLDPHKQSTTTIVSVKRLGNLALVEQQYDMQTVKSGQDGSIKNIKLHAESIDTWVLVHGTWLAKRSVTNLMDYQVNGVVLAHKVRPDPCPQ